MSGRNDIVIHVGTLCLPIVRLTLPHRLDRAQILSFTYVEGVIDMTQIESEFSMDSLPTGKYFTEASDHLLQI